MASHFGPIEATLAPADLMYADPRLHRPPNHVDVDQVPKSDQRVAKLVESVSVEDRNEADVLDVTSPMFVAMLGHEIVSVCGYRVWVGARSRIYRYSLTQTLAIADSRSQWEVPLPPMPRPTGSFPSGAPDRRPRSCGPLPWVPGARRSAVPADRCCIKQLNGTERAYRIGSNEPHLVRRGWLVGPP
jgi:hypothetical protein